VTERAQRRGRAIAMTAAEVDEFLATERTCRVATSGKDGRPHVVPLWIARPLPDPEIGLVLYRAINLAHIVFGPLVEQMLGLSLTDPAVLERFRNAAIDLLTHPVFNVPPSD